MRGQGSDCTIFVGSGTKLICHAFGVKYQKFGYKNEISDEKTYLPKLISVNLISLARVFNLDV